MKLLWMIPLLIGLIVLLLNINAETIIQNLEGEISIGYFFIVPYVSLGTIIAIPLGAIISLLIRRNQNSGKKHHRKKKH